MNYLNRTLAAKLKSKTLQDHDIICGTAHTFQGDERDVMLISFCADPSSHRSTVTFLNNDNLFNVAVTRARRRQVIFTGLDPRNLPTEHLLREYLTYAAPTAWSRTIPRPTPTQARRIRARSARLCAPMAATRPGSISRRWLKIDVVAQYGAQALAIAADGDPEAGLPWRRRAARWSASAQESQAGAGRLARLPAAPIAAGNASASRVWLKLTRCWAVAATTRRPTSTSAAVLHMDYGLGH